ncbi:threonine/serine exporter family protein [Mycolicibacterium sp. CBM1]
MASLVPDQQRMADEHGESALDTIVRAAALLHDHGQSTSMTLIAADRLARGLDQPCVLVMGWSAITAYDPRQGGAHPRVAATRPNAVNMRKVAALMSAVDDAEDRPLHRDEVERALSAADRLPASSTPAFVTASAVCAAALAIVFGATTAWTVIAVAVAAGVGAIVRRALDHWAFGPLTQTFSAAFIAGIASGLATQWPVGAESTLVALCPAMILVPGPQVLIGAMDLLAFRMPLALARLGYASLILATIAAGLVVGLGLTGHTLALGGADAQVPLAADVLAAGVAAGCYPVFFSTPYRLLIWPIGIGMAAHALHWWVLQVGNGGVPLAALASSLLVGAIMTPVASWQRIPFAAVGFAAVVALVPGMFVFRAVAGFMELATGATASPQLLGEIAVNGATATLTVVCMAIGLALPTRVRDRILHRRHGPPTTGHVTS